MLPNEHGFSKRHVIFTLLPPLKPFITCAVLVVEA